MKREGYEIIGLEDGFLDPSSVAPKVCFGEFRRWPEVERRGVVRVGGRVLNVGCGASRVPPTFRGRSWMSLGIDSSPLTLKVTKARGVTKTRLLSIKDVDFEQGSFDTAVMCGNDFGPFGSWGRAKRLLKRLRLMTSPGAKIICVGVDPYKRDTTLTAFDTTDGTRRVGGCLGR